MSKQQIWVRSGERVRGPYFPAQFREMARSGEISPETQISLDRLVWTSAKNVRGIEFAQGSATGDRLQTQAGTGEGGARRSAKRKTPLLPAAGEQGVRKAKDGSQGDVSGAAKHARRIARPAFYLSAVKQWWICIALHRVATWLGACLLATMIGLLLLAPVEFIANWRRTMQWGAALPATLQATLQVKQVLLSIPMQYVVLICFILAMSKNRNALRLPWTGLLLIAVLLLVTTPFLVALLNTAGLGTLLVAIVVTIALAMKVRSTG